MSTNNDIAAAAELKKRTYRMIVPICCDEWTLSVELTLSFSEANELTGVKSTLTNEAEAPEPPTNMADGSVDAKDVVDAEKELSTMTNGVDAEKKVETEPTCGDEEKKLETQPTDDGGDKKISANTEEEVGACYMRGFVAACT